ncbi:MAG TPA: aspartyl protease family protein [Gaiellaceae bacterium]
MGTFSIRIAVSGSSSGPFVPVDVLVDTGATYTVLPKGLLEELGVEPHYHGEFGLADGTVVERDVGRVWVRYENRLEHTFVVFGEDRLLGAVTLEELNRAVDPIQQRLVPVIAFMKRAA